MEVRNVHERTLAVPVGAAGRPIDGLASPGDGRWPHARWPRTRPGRPLGPRAAGGHGPICCRAEAYEPPRSVSFRFVAAAGFEGSQGFEAEAVGERECRLRHVLVMRTPAACTACLAARLPAAPRGADRGRPGHGRDRARVARALAALVAPGATPAAPVRPVPPRPAGPAPLIAINRPAVRARAAVVAALESPGRHAAVLSRGRIPLQRAGPRDSA